MPTGQKWIFLDAYDKAQGHVSMSVWSYQNVAQAYRETHDAIFSPHYQRLQERQRRDRKSERELKAK